MSRAAGLSDAWRIVPRIYLAGLAIVTLIGSALRLRAVFYPLRHDEAYTFLTSGLQAVWTTLSTYDSPANHMLHSALVRISCLLFGNQEWAIRMPALLAGILVIPTTFAAFTVLADYGAALLAAALVACSHPMIAFSANARGYSQAALFTLVMVLLASRLRTRPSKTAWVVLVLCAVAALYTIPSMLYGVAMVWTWMALESARDDRRIVHYRDLLLSTAAVGILTALLYLPSILRSGWDALFRNQFVAPMNWLNFSTAFPGSIAATFFDWRRSMPAAISVAVSLGFFAFVIAAVLFKSHRPLFRLLLAAVVSIGAILLVQKVAPPSRVWLFLLPLFLGMAATGVTSLAELAIGFFHYSGQSRPAVRMLLVALIVLVCAWMALPLARPETFLSDSESRDLPAVAGYLRPQLHPADAVLAAPPLDFPLVYYLYRREPLPGYISVVPQNSGRSFLVLDSRYMPERGTAVGRVFFDPNAAQRLLVLKKWNAATLYELPTAALRRESISAPNGIGRAAAAVQNRDEIRK